MLRQFCLHSIWIASLSLYICARSTSNIGVTTNSIVFVAPPTKLDTYYDSMKPTLYDYYAQFINVVNSNNSPNQCAFAIVDDYGKDELTKRNVSSKNILLNEVGYEMQDIWIRDFGTVQVDNILYKFIYQPDYLSKHQATLIDNAYRQWLYHNKVDYINVSIILDGGNFVFERNTKKLIVTTRILHDNPLYNKTQMIQYLKTTMNINEIAIITEENLGNTGHADGMVTFINNNIIGINNYTSKNQTKFYNEIVSELYDAFGKLNIKIVNLPYDPTWERYKNFWSAKGIYSNVLTGVYTDYSPIYSISTDDTENIHILQQYSASNVNVKGVNATAVSIMGGSVRCLSWYIWGKPADQFIQNHNIKQ